MTDSPDDRAHDAERNIPGWARPPGHDPDAYRAAEDCVPGRSHRFDRLSGWCGWGCGNRDDGRIVTRHGVVLRRGPTYSMEALASIRATFAAEAAARSVPDQPPGGTG